MNPTLIRDGPRAPRAWTHAPVRFAQRTQMLLTRRNFLQAGGAALALALGLPAMARADGAAEPRPIPGGIQPLLPGNPTLFHILLPGYPPAGSPDPATNDPSVITDFNGHIGLSYIQGTGTRTDRQTGEVKHLPFEVDLRFMKGEYVGLDGHHHHAAFALI